MKWASHRVWLLVPLLLLFSAPAGAQLPELPWPPSRAAEMEREAPPSEVDRSARKPSREERAPESPSDRATPLAPPSTLARPLPAERVATLPKPEAQNTLLILFLSLLGVGLVLFAVERARSWLTANVALHRVLGVFVLVLRLAGAGLLLGIVLELIPEGQDWILWAAALFALVIGWSIRDLFADMVAGAVLAAERRVKRGVWVSGNGFQGTVEGRSLRATWLRDGQGHRLTVPNRAMVGAPMVYDAGADAEHEVVVRLEGYQDAGKVRMALTDAILSSPWVLAGANPIVLRDPADPVVWRVRTKLLEPRFSVHFEGELLERVEDLLRHQPERKEDAPKTGDDEPIEA